jgi:hypothetical protein
MFVCRKPNKSGKISVQAIEKVRGSIKLLNLLEPAFSHLRSKNLLQLESNGLEIMIIRYFASRVG